MLAKDKFHIGQRVQVSELGLAKIRRPSIHRRAANTGIVVGFPSRERDRECVRVLCDGVKHPGVFFMGFWEPARDESAQPSPTKATP